MSNTSKYPRRLIEVDLPIKRISAQATREKSIRHGHISTLHIWWARRPLAACRAVLCAALWPDPADPLCPSEFQETARDLMKKWAKDNVKLKLLEGDESFGHFIAYQKNPDKLNDNRELRKALLDFIATFSNWDNSTKTEFLETSRILTQVSHESLGGIPGTKPLVVDPFAGGGSIPLEALRVGADAFASDLNPVAVLLNKVVLEYIPKYGQTLADEVRKWGEWIKKEAEKELAEFYPKDPDGATPIAYLWARTIICEGPGCGAEVPLMRSLWLAKKSSKSAALRIVPDVENKRVNFEIIEDATSKDVKDGTVKRGSATCPCCGYTTPVASVRKQLKARKGGANDARLFCVVTTRLGQQGRFYRLPAERDLEAVRKAKEELERRCRGLQLNAPTGLSLVPDEPLPPQGTLGFRVQLYGMEQWGDLFTSRQLLALTTLVKLVRLCRGVQLNAPTEIDRNGNEIPCNGNTNNPVDDGLNIAVKTCLAMAIDRCADKCASLVIWNIPAEKVEHVFGRQALPIVWDYVDTNILSDIGLSGAIDWVYNVIFKEALKKSNQGTVYKVNASKHSLPDDIAQAFISDPPYYDAVPYADLSDFFIVWLKRTVGDIHIDLFNSELAPKDEECIVDEIKGKDNAYFESTMAQAMAEGRRILHPDGIGVVVFAHKSTSGWEAQLQAMIDAGWIITGSWPIDTERPGRLRSQDSAALASSVHLVCRPRESPDGGLRTNLIGDWRDVLQELPVKIHEWMPRLASEGIVGADAIFACLGPALEVFSRYSRVEKASGEVVTLREYLEHIWAAVSKEALNMIFKDADASGFEEDSRLTAMWLWTLSTGNGKVESVENNEEEESEDEESEGSKKKPAGGFVLEYDTARKIAQGLGAHMDKLSSVVEIKGNKARLLPVSERSRFLFGKNDSPVPKQKKKKDKQMDLFKELLADTEEINRDTGDISRPEAGNTVMDRLHQAMLLFGAGRSEALKRFLVEDAVGQDLRFWKLAQAFSALYPSNTDEKRWIDGVMTRKKGLGF
ncbi:MAG TPA: DUF1156 domain-containing protein [Candidatus Eremiobacteraeota bacterium]|nr:MAG: hypothetical protein BWY64_00205 [bacterium ADurb.Bin363]HPZ08273.1 DUF1156 domain-containing protein [Candidatus Eremiobacteraeota bacterium]